MATKLRKIGVDDERLSDKQRIFISEYSMDYNARRAAREAGYRNPGTMGPRLLKNRIVKAVLGKIQRDNLERVQLTREAVIQELAYCAMRDPLELIDDQGRIKTDLRQISESLRRTVDAIEQEEWYDEEGNRHCKTKLKLVPKQPCLRMAMEHFGLFAAQKHEVNVSVDWTKLYERGDVEEADPIEAAILNVHNDDANGVGVTVINPLEHDDYEPQG